MAEIPQKITPNAILSKIPGPYQQHHLTTVDSTYDIKVAKIQGQFIWHAHPDSDEVFYVIKGELIMDIRVGDKEERRYIQQGELIRIPVGVQHRPDSVEGCEIMLFEKDTVNTGDAEENERTHVPVKASEA